MHRWTNDRGTRVGYHFGRYEPPPSTPAIPAYVREAVDLPALTERGSLRVPQPPPQAARLRELEVVERAVAERTPEMRRWVEHMDQRGATSMWWGAARETRRTRGALAGLELRAALVAGHLGDLVASYAQLRPGVPRPFQMQPELEVLGRVPRSSSFPSGHTRNAFSSARIVARLDPAQAARAYADAGLVGYSRLLAGAHVGSDIAAGARLGVAVGDAVVGAVQTARAVAPVLAVAGGTWLLHHASSN